MMLSNEFWYGFGGGAGVTLLIGLLATLIMRARSRNQR
jgi:hypothetical protein